MGCPGRSDGKSRRRDACLFNCLEQTGVKLAEREIRLSARCMAQDRTVFPYDAGEQFLQMAGETV